MDISDIPVGQTTVIADTPSIKSTFTRISEQYGIIEYFHPTNGTMVLKAKVGVHTGTTEVQYQDQNFWNVTVNGRPIGSGEQANGKLTINPETRTINVTT